MSELYHNNIKQYKFWYVMILPDSCRRKENINIMQNERVEIMQPGYPKTFSPDTRKKLLGNEYKIYVVEDKTLEDLRQEGKKIFSSWYRNNSQYDFDLRRTGRAGYEIAINPQSPFDERQTHLFKATSYIKKQLLQAQTHAGVIRQRFGIKDIYSVLPEACEVAWVMFTVEEQLGIRLAERDFVPTRTTVSLDWPDYVYVGVHDNKGLRIQSQRHGNVSGGRVLPFIMPAGQIDKKE